MKLFIFTYSLVVVLIAILGFLIEKHTLSYISARRIAVCACSITVIPLSFIVVWPFAIFATFIFTLVIYVIFWGGEKIENQKNRESKN
jgi:flagellar assembly factor FliW